MAPQPLLRTMLFLLVLFFLAMGSAHFLGVKWPVLFIYYDTPFYGYQDRIISFTLVTYAALYWAAAFHRVILPFVLISAWSTVLGLAYVNISQDLADVLTADQDTMVYWLQTGALAVAAIILTILTLREPRATP
ncbi:MAG: hypothetical protein AAF557_12670 [Pseudomonadota bacterium]